MSVQNQKISVCLPVFNGAKYLAEAIESVLAQSYANFELLIVDDQSTDKSQAIAQQYAQKDKRVVYWRNETNKGIFANYNECLNRAQGDFIKLFAQDDVLEPNCLSLMLEQLLANQNVLLVASARMVIDENSRQTAIERFFDDTIVIPGAEVIKNYVRTFVYRTGTPAQVMLRRSSMGTGFNPKFILSGDIEYFLRILETGDFLYLNEVLVRFRRHAESVTVTALKDMSFVTDSVRLANKYEHYLVEAGQTTPPAVRNALIEGLIRKVNNAIYDRKIQFKMARNSGTAVDASNDAVDFEKIAYEFLLYSAQTKMRLEQAQHLLAGKDDQLRKQLELREHLESQRSQLEAQIWELKQQLIDSQRSNSWKIIQPLRWLVRPFGL